MKAIDNIFEDSVNIPLYHYTGIGSLLGIAKGEALWASSISYMNDSREIVHACETVERVLQSRLAFGRQDEEHECLTQLQKYTEFLSTLSHKLFVFSLSEKPNLLSQWRSYTPHGKGVSLEFSAEKVNYIAKHSDMKIARCIYDEIGQREIITALIERLLVNFRQQLPHMPVFHGHPSQCYSPFLDQYKNDILQVLAIIKDEAFEEECEWRLISPHYPEGNNTNLKFREGASMLVPYIELPLGNKPFFSHVRMGPSQHQNLAFEGLMMYLSNENISNSLGNCQIPYREW
ncbi:hypothetical protein AKG98_1639 [Moritella sp. JT01]|uniref:DUF2971 domain-containing protein n=1 Tax=Moritella sp. JT01 TaxID=756698 RepID=UPI0007995AD2|nr:DUF2971 domain-containing protein [Moritella sp. JT01]KXO13894.1 hypothetical protein AKG98_1639 [Moritella sp. JT01]